MLLEQTTTNIRVEIKRKVIVYILDSLFNRIYFILELN